MDEKEEIRQEIKETKQKESYTRYMTKSGIRRALKDAGAVIISKEAVEELGFLLKDIITDISTQSVLMCNHRNSTIVKGKDVQIATK